MSIAVQASAGDLIVFLDGDVDPFPHHFVPGLLGPVLTDDDVALVKASYLRPLNGVLGEGGRVNERIQIDVSTGQAELAQKTGVVY